VDVDTLNKQFYERPDIAEAYSHDVSLWPEEQFIFQFAAEHIRDRNVPDIGCGGGRTTRTLRQETRYYVGLDYSEKMIELCRRTWPDLTFVHGDASDMHMFAADQFDFVLFSFNGIDCISHNNRLKALREIYRVLKPGGVFAFSSHNRDDRRIVTAIDIRDFSIKNNLQYLRSYIRVRKLQERRKTYAILSDPIAGFGCLSYYIRKGDQVKQLTEAGFQDIRILNQACSFVDPLRPDHSSKWFHYLCSKP